MITPTNILSKHYLVLPTVNFRSRTTQNFTISFSGIQL
jgi:hypothetical protein